MIIDARDITPQYLDTDICIIGSGIGGGSVVHALSNTNIRFTIIEAGPMRGSSDNVKIENTGLGFGLSTTTAIEMGGTSNLWHGVLAPLDPIDFKKRDWIPHSGWPVTYSDIFPFFEKASRLFSIPHHGYFFEETLSEELKKEIPKMPITRDLVANKFFQQPLPALRFKDIIKKIVASSDRNHCILNATALELKSNSSNPKQIEKVVIADDKGTFLELKAKKFILAAGALETPRLLLNSRESFSKGLGNEHGNVGRFLMDHPMGNLFQIEFINPQKAHLYSDMKYHRNCKIKSGLVLKDEVQEKLRLPNHNFYMRPSFVRGINNESEQIKLALLTFKDKKKGLSFKDIAKVLANYNVAYQILAYKFALNVKYRYADIFFLTEQIPNKHSYVSLSEKKDKFGFPVSRVNWSITQQDSDWMTDYYKILTSKVFPESHFRITHREQDLKWNEVFSSAAHHVGTARMASSERDGVIDANQKVFNTENLYVSDGSLFTTSGNINSGFSISAFSLRLAEHLSHLLKNGK